MIGDSSRDIKLANMIHFDNEDLLKRDSLFYDFDQKTSDKLNEWYNQISHNQWTNLKFENILDIGSGVGFPLLNICLSKRKSKVISVDISHKSLEYCRMISKKIGVNPFLVQSDGEFLPFKDCSFDAIVGNAIIHHIPDTRKIANEIYRLLKPNGICIITGESTKRGTNINQNIKKIIRFPLYFKLKRKKDGEITKEDLVDVHTFYIKDLRNKFEVNNFQIIEIKTSGIISPIIEWLLMKIIHKNIKTDFINIITKIFRKIDNMVFKRILSDEYLLEITIFLKK